MDFSGPPLKNVQGHVKHVFLTLSSSLVIWMLFLLTCFFPPTTQNQNSKPDPFLSSWTWTAWGFYFAFMQHLFSYGFALSVLLAPLLAVYSVEWAEHLVQALAQECAWEKMWAMKKRTYKMGPYWIHGAPFLMAKKLHVFHWWWNFTYLLFSPRSLGKWSKFDEHIFQMGWWKTTN